MEKVVLGAVSKPIIDTWIMPKLKELCEKSKTNKELLEHVFVNKFEEYLQRSYEKYSMLSTIAFRNQQRLLEDIYIPLTLKSARVDINEKILVDTYSDVFIPKYKKVLITDTAGMGKSTILKWLFLSCAKQNKGIPVFIELRRLSADKEILDEIFTELNPLKDAHRSDFILSIIERGDFVFFLDGYDEIPFKEKDVVTNKLQEFISKASNNLFILSSRPEIGLATFGDFQEFNIVPLEEEEAHELLKKYDQAGELSSRLIEEITRPDVSRNIREFLSNPLLVTLLYKAFEFKPNIPKNKRVYYRQVYDALF